MKTLSVSAVVKTFLAIISIALGGGTSSTLIPVMHHSARSQGTLPFRGKIGAGVNPKRP